MKINYLQSRFLLQAPTISYTLLQNKKSPTPPTSYNIDNESVGVVGAVGGKIMPYFGKMKIFLYISSCEVKLKGAQVPGLLLRAFLLPKNIAVLYLRRMAIMALQSPLMDFASGKGSTAFCCLV